MNVKQLKEWLASLPPEFDNAEVQSTVLGIPSQAKRVFAYKWKDSGSLGIVVNSMGTHLSDDFCRDIERVSSIGSGGNVSKP